jgi:hypothetical protein
MTDGNDELGSIHQTLKEILRWIRFANISKLKETLDKELDIDEKKLAYDNSDGINGVKEVAQASGAPQDTVYSWWQKWFRLGLVVESETRKGRMVKIVSLDDVGIKLPKKKKNPTMIQTSAQQESQAPSEATGPKTTEDPRT